MITNRSLYTFKNFRGLFTKNESGLIPSDPATGVYASAMQNVTCEDGTITFLQGYTKQTNSAGALTTYALTDDTYARFSYSYRRMDGAQVALLFLNNGKILWLNETKNHWEILKTGLTSTLDYGAIAFMLAATNIYDRSRVFFGNGTDNNMFWNAAMTTFASSTSSTITKQGSGSWTAAGFTATGSIIINNTEYAYTGGVSTTALTGVTPDPTAVAHVAADGAAQVVNTSTMPTSLKGNIFFVYGSRLFITSTASTQIIGSKIAAPTDYSTSGIGGTVTVNIGDGAGAINSIGSYADSFIVHKDNGIIPVTIKLVDATTEVTKIDALVLRDQVGGTSIHAVSSGEDESYFVSKDKEFKAISRVLQDEKSAPSSTSLSSFVNPTLRLLYFSATSMIVNQKQVYFSCSTSSTGLNDTVVQYDAVNKAFYFHKKAVGSFFTIGNDVFFTSPAEIQVYKWRDSYDDDDGSVGYLWRSGRFSFNDEFRKKRFTVIGVHMRMLPSTTVTVDIDYNIDGSLAQYTFDVKGDGTSKSNSTYVLSDPLTETYGSNRFGIKPYGSSTSTSVDSDLAEVIVFHSLPGVSPYDVTFKAPSAPVPPKTGIGGVPVAESICIFVPSYCTKISWLANISPVPKSAPPPFFFIVFAPSPLTLREHAPVFAVPALNVNICPTTYATIAGVTVIA